MPFGTHDVQATRRDHFLFFGIGCSSVQCTEQSRIEVGDARNLVIEDRRAVGDGTVSLAERTTVLAAKDVDG